MARSLDELMRAGRYRKALRGIKSGRLDPASAPDGVYFAARAKNPDLLRRFLAAGADANYGSRPRPIQVAARAGLLANVELLLAAGADPNAGSAIGSPLGEAVRHGHDDVSAALVRGGASDETESESMLVHAVFHGLQQTVAEMLEAGFHLDGRASIETGLRQSSGAPRSAEDGQETVVYDRATAAVVAAGEGAQGMLEVLVAAGADLSAPDDSGLTPYAAAERGGHDELAAWIEAAGGVREADLGPNEAFLIAAEAGDPKAIRAAIDRGADPDTRDARPRTLHRTPLLLAVAAGHPEAVLAILEAGADPELRDRPPGTKATGAFGEPATRSSLDLAGVRFGLTPLALASVFDEEGCAEILVSGGADPHAKDDLGCRCVHLAAANGSSAVLRVLLAAGADPSAKGRQGSPVVLAAGDEHAECVALLLGAGADPNDGDGEQTALHLAAMLGSGEMIEALLEAEADATARNWEGKTALDVAEDFTSVGLAKIDAAVLERLRTATGSAAGEAPSLSEPPAPPELPQLDNELAGHYSAESTRTRLVDRSSHPAFSAYLADLAARAGTEARPMLGGAAFSLRVHSVKATDTLAGEIDIEGLQKEAAPHEALVTDGSAAGQKGDLVIWPTVDALEAVAAMRTCGPNDDILPTHVLEFFRTHPAILTRVAPDALAGRFTSAIDDPKTLAEEVYALCPDSVDQGVGDLERLAERLAETGQFALWWD